MLGFAWARSHQIEPLVPREKEKEKKGKMPTFAPVDLKRNTQDSLIHWVMGGYLASLMEAPVQSLPLSSKRTRSKMKVGYRLCVLDKNFGLAEQLPVHSSGN